MNHAARATLVPVAYVLPCRYADTGAIEVLLQRRYNTGHYDGFWTCGATGHVEDGESVSAAAVREASQEVGITIDPDPEFLTPLCVVHRRSGTAPIDQRVDFFYTCWEGNWRGEPRIMEPHKADGLAWFPLEALPDPMMPHEGKVLRLLRSAWVPPVVEFGFEPPEVMS